jgi:hypothetical protein
MKNRRDSVLFNLLTGLLFVCSLSVEAPAAFGTENEKASWVMPQDNKIGTQIFSLTGERFGDVRSYLYRASFQPMVDVDDPTCTSFSDTKCSDALLNYRALIPNCDANYSFDCVEGLEVIDDTGLSKRVYFDGYFPLRSQNAFEGDTKLGIPSGVSGGIYKTLSPDGNVEKYFVAAMIDGSGINKSFSRDSIDVRVYKVREKRVTFATNAQDNGIVRINNGAAGIKVGTYSWQVPGFIENTNCVALSVTTSNCLEQLDFREDTRLKLSLRLKSLPSGWMHGRLTNPAIEISSMQDYEKIVVSAEPVVSPIIYKSYSWSEMPSSLVSSYELSSGKYIRGFSYGTRGPPSTDPNNRIVIISPPAYSKEAKEQFELWNPFLNDKSTAENSSWNFRTLSPDEAYGANSCFISKNKLTGIVTSNSTTYTAGPPKFDPKTDSLDYEVAAPHFSSNGEEFKGSYDLIMSHQVAECLYGFSGGSAKATISVINSEGSKQIATTTFDSKDGWLHLAARGFMFSSPTIKVKLEKNETFNPLPSSSPTQIVSESTQTKSKNTITCVKGKTNKKVTGTKPKCPAGYKKK